MNTRIYVKYSLWDFLLTAAVSIALTYTVLNGFYIEGTLQHSVLPAMVALVCLVALFAVTISRKTMLIGGVIYVVVLFIAYGVCASYTPDFRVLTDFEENYCQLAMVLTLVSTICFLLSRTLFGSAVLFIVGAFTVGFVQLFWGNFELLWTFVFVAAALALIIYRNYLKSVKTAMGVERVSFAPGFLVALCATVVAVGLGAGIWYGIIAPLGPQAADIKLITEYRALETLQVRGISDVYQAPDLSMTSDVTNNDFRTTDDIKEDINGTRWPATGEDDSDEELQDAESSGTFMGINLENIQEAFNLQANPQNWPLLLLLIIPVLLIVAYFVLRRVWRTRRLEKFRLLGPDGEFEQVFLFLIDRFRRLGVTVPPGQTIREFGVSSASVLHFQDAEAGVPFKDLTISYASLAYGKKSVSSEDSWKAESHYRAFWKATRKQLGAVKYFFKSFRL